MSEEHIVVHEGSPRPDPSPFDWLVWLYLGLLAIAALLTALFYAAIIGAISYAVYWALTQNYTQLKMTLGWMKIHDNNLRKARDNEARARAPQAGISDSDHAAMIEAAKGRTQKAEEEWRRERAKCASISRDILAGLRTSREQLLENEGKRHSGKLKDTLAKVDVEIGRMECLLRYAEGQLPEQVRIKDFQNLYACAEYDKGAVLRTNREVASHWEQFALIRLDGNRIALLASNGRFVTADGNKGWTLVADRKVFAQWEQFELQDVSDGCVALKACNGRFVSSRLDDGKTMRACAEDVQEWERFRICN